ncbi:Barrel-sandwich domain of CusB or HlyD membrane-fusion [Chitinophaga sp. CF118]|uniref:efflux RND transporter periplasmic adaptor subunit n=1 Tax=Chitinophaga sp. CF118 TaxID=1884367 RepID=UPI0008F26B6D|nr:efflux RND transporter periplasmic adaptor subunit [Chitinophaga sp. CF118]SFD11747.1 Barrel-sandwich domain of CusB or HlyD membrane-fusion [Chitinophaga sp. CF118]
MMKQAAIFLFCFALAAITACDSHPDTAVEDTSEAGVPVTITSISTGPMTENIELNATSSFQLKTYIKANTTGYLQAVNVYIGEYISKGQEIFVIKTKEAEALGNTINALDSSFRFTGLLHIKSPGSGYVSTLTYKKGDYVQDGEQLAVISDKNSFAFLLDIPYELKSYLNSNKNIVIKLPDGTRLNGYVASSMPSVDPVAQTQSIVIKVNTDQQIPEGLIAKAVLVKEAKENTISLPKEAVLTNETQTSFWIMKLTDSVTAVRVPVKKGLENGSMVEILSPAFSVNDKILLTGNYGLSDTAKVSVK